jgi:hypothetical protein
MGFGLAARRGCCVTLNLSESSVNKLVAVGHSEQSFTRHKAARALSANGDADPSNVSPPGPRRRNAGGGDRAVNRALLAMTIFYALLAVVAIRSTDDVIRAKPTQTLHP